MNAELHYNQTHFLQTVHPTLSTLSSMNLTAQIAHESSFKSKLQSEILDNLLFTE